MIFDLENQVNQVVKDIEDTDYLLGKMQMQPFRAANSSSRALMDSVHIEHYMVEDRGEPPIIATGYENEYGRNSSSFITADDDYRVICKIDKFSFKPNYHYFLITQNIHTGEYDYIERVCYKPNTESYGYLYNNDIIDMMSPGSTIHKGQIVKTSNGFDEYGNKMNGVNLTTLYLSCDKNKEDSVIISESAAKKLKTNLINTTDVIINDNDILLNLYGNDKVYKAFPDVGEDIKNGIFCSIRRLLNENALYSLAQDKLTDIMMSDRNVLMNGTVADIDVYCNNPETLGDSHYNQQLYFYHTEKLKFCQTVNDTIAPLAMNGQLSFKLKKLYAKCRDVINGKQHIKDGRLFNNVTMKIVIIEPLPMNTGDKMADRHGGKGIVSYVLPDELMPRLDNGKHVECIKNQSTCINRENVGQLHEQSLTFIGSRILDYFRLNVLSYKEMATIWYEFVSMVDIEQAQEIKETFGDFSDEYKLKLMMDSILEEDDAIFLSVRPFRTPINIDTIAEIYKKFPWIKPYSVEVPIKDSNNNIRFVKTNRPLVVGKIYNYRLKQYAEEKFSVTSLSATNLKNLNSKSKDKKNFETKFKKTPIMLGPMESGDLSNLGMEYVVMNLLLYSSSPQGRRLFEQLLTTDDPYNIDIKLDNESKNRNVEIINALFKAIGYKLTFEKIPKKAQDMCLNVMATVVKNQDFKGYKTRIRDIIGHDDELQLRYNAAIYNDKSKDMCNVEMCEIVDKDDTGKDK